MSDVLLVAIFTAHLLAADVAMAGPLVAIWIEWRGQSSAEPVASEQIARRLAVWSVAGIVVAVGLGLVAVFALPHLEPRGYREAFGQVPASRWWNAAGEIVFFVICMIPYIAFWRWFARHRWWGRLVAVMAATDLIYHFPPLFTIISTLSLRPELKGKELDVALYHRLMYEGESFSRIVHHWIAGVAVAAVAAMIIGVRWAVVGTRDKGQGAADEASPAAVVRSAARVAMFATVAQVAVGVWVLLAMSPAMQNQLLGEDWVSTALFGLSVIAALGLMHHLAIVALGATSRANVYRTALVMAIVVALMTATLHRARQRVLEPAKVALAVPATVGPACWTGPSALML